MKFLQKTAITILFGASSLYSHTLWVNSFESKHNHGTHHSMVSLGWGHALPFGDQLNSVNGRVGIQNFSLYDPDMKEFELYKPKLKLAKPSLKNENFDIYKADSALQKIALKKDSKKGVYQLGVKTNPTYYTKYIDTKDRVRLKLKPKNEIKNLKKSLMSLKYQGYGKSFITLGKWEKPKTLGHDLEITPLSDLSKLKAGDLVEFYITLKGKPISHSPKGIKFATFWSKNYGQDDKFEIMSYIKKGKAQFRVPSSGQWVMKVFDGHTVTKDGKSKELYGKVDTYVIATSITFDVKDY